MSEGMRRFAKDAIARAKYREDEWGNWSWPLYDTSLASQIREDSLGLARALLDALDENERLSGGYGLELADVENELAPALGYSHEEGYGWVTGDHTQVTLAMEARRTIDHLRSRVEELETTLELVRMSVAVIMARPGCDLSIDRDAKLDALEKIDAALSPKEAREEGKANNAG